MKKKLLTGAFLLAALAISAQTTEKKQATVRIKKVEKINGVETVIDTTFTTDDPSTLKLGDGTDIQTINIIGDDKEGGTMEKIVIINDDSGNGHSSKVKVISKGDGQVSEKDMQEIMKEVEKEMKEAEKHMKLSEKDMKISEQRMKEAEQALTEVEIELREAGKNAEGKSVKKVILVNDEGTSDGKTITKIVMLKMDITDASPEDVKRLGAGSVDNKIEMENMKLYPNPNDGKFNLNFNLKNKGDAEVTVYDLQGKQVYNEKLPNFSGEYNKPIDISSNAKGIYFVKIQQGKHTQVKKISLD